MVLKILEISAKPNAAGSSIKYKIRLQKGEKNSDTVLSISINRIHNIFSKINSHCPKGTANECIVYSFKRICNFNPDRDYT
jgi:hypothetical protein